MKFLLVKLDNEDGKKYQNKPTKLSGEELAKKGDSHICDIG